MCQSNVYGIIMINDVELWFNTTKKVAITSSDQSPEPYKEFKIEIKTNMDFWTH